MTAAVPADPLRTSPTPTNVQRSAALPTPSFPRGASGRVQITRAPGEAVTASVAKSIKVEAPCGPPSTGQRKFEAFPAAQ
jgi:hypothetical protein